MSEPVPEHVLEGLEDLRASGVCNMLGRGDVIVSMMRCADDGEWPLTMEEVEYRTAIAWLLDNPDRYMEALIAMGEHRRE